MPANLDHPNRGVGRRFNQNQESQKHQKSPKRSSSLGLGGSFNQRQETNDHQIRRKGSGSLGLGGLFNQNQELNNNRTQPEKSGSLGIGELFNRHQEPNDRQIKRKKSDSLGPGGLFNQNQESNNKKKTQREQPNSLGLGKLFNRHQDSNDHEIKREEPHSLGLGRLFNRHQDPNDHEIKREEPHSLGLGRLFNRHQDPNDREIKREEPHSLGLGRLFNQNQKSTNKQTQREEPDSLGLGRLFNQNQEPINKQAQREKSESLGLGGVFNQNQESINKQTQREKSLGLKGLFNQNQEPTNKQTQREKSGSFGIGELFNRHQELNDPQVKRKRSDSLGLGGLFNQNHDSYNHQIPREKSGSLGLEGPFDQKHKSDDHKTADEKSSLHGLQRLFHHKKEESNNRKTMREASGSLGPRKLSSHSNKCQPVRKESKKLFGIKNLGKLRNFMKACDGKCVEVNKDKSGEVNEAKCRPKTGDAKQKEVVIKDKDPQSDSNPNFNSRSSLNQNEEGGPTARSRKECDPELCKNYALTNNLDPAKLTEIINKSIKEAVQCIVGETPSPPCWKQGPDVDVTQCRRKDQERQRSKVSVFQDKENSSVHGNKLPSIGGTNETYNSHKTNGQNHYPILHRPADTNSITCGQSVSKYNQIICPYVRQPVKSKKPSIPGSGKPCKLLKTDNRRMTGNVNIYICSEATEGVNKKKKTETPSVSATETDTSHVYNGSSASTSSSKVICNLMKKRRRSEDVTMNCVCDKSEDTSDRCPNLSQKTDMKTLCLCDMSSLDPGSSDDNEDTGRGRTDYKTKLWNDMISTPYNDRSKRQAMSMSTNRDDLYCCTEEDSGDARSEFQDNSGLTTPRSKFTTCNGASGVTTPDYPCFDAPDFREVTTSKYDTCCRCDRNDGDDQSQRQNAPYYREGKNNNCCRNETPMRQQMNDEETCRCCRFDEGPRMRSRPRERDCKVSGQRQVESNVCRYREPERKDACVRERTYQSSGTYQRENCGQQCPRYSNSCIMEEDEICDANGSTVSLNNDVDCKRLSFSEKDPDVCRNGDNNGYNENGEDVRWRTNGGTPPGATTDSVSPSSNGTEEAVAKSSTCRVQKKKSGSFFKKSPANSPKTGIKSVPAAGSPKQVNGRPGVSGTPKQQNGQPGRVSGTLKQENIQPGRVSGTLKQENIQPGRISGTLKPENIQPGRVSGTLKQENIQPGRISGTLKPENIQPGRVSGTLKQENIQPGRISGTLKPENIQPGRVSGTLKQENIQPGRVSGTLKQENGQPRAIPGALEEGDDQPGIASDTSNQKDDPKKSVFRRSIEKAKNIVNNRIPSLGTSKASPGKPISPKVNGSAVTLKRSDSPKGATTNLGAGTVAAKESSSPGQRKPSVGEYPKKDPNVQQIKSDSPSSSPSKLSNSKLGNLIASRKSSLQSNGIESANDESKKTSCRCGATNSDVCTCGSPQCPSCDRPQEDCCCKPVPDINQCCDKQWKDSENYQSRGDEEYDCKCSDEQYKVCTTCSQPQECCCCSKPKTVVEQSCNRCCLPKSRCCCEPRPPRYQQPPKRCTRENKRCCNERCGKQQRKEPQGCQSCGDEVCGCKSSGEQFRVCILCCRPEEDCRCNANSNGCCGYAKMKSQICVYCDNPQDECVCRAPVRKCSFCGMPLDVCNCQEVDNGTKIISNRNKGVCICNGGPARSPDGGDHLICVSSWKPRKNVRKYFARDPDDLKDDSDECCCYEDSKPYGSDELPYQRLSVFSDVMSELQQKMSELACCDRCRKTPCCCCLNEAKNNPSPANEGRSCSPEQGKSRSRSPSSCRCGLSPWRCSHGSPRKCSPPRACNRCRTTPCRCRRSRSAQRKPQAKCYYCKSSPCRCESKQVAGSKTCRCGESPPRYRDDKIIEPERNEKKCRVRDALPCPVRKSGCRCKSPNCSPGKSKCPGQGKGKLFDA